MREQKLKDKLEEINQELITNGTLDTKDVGVLSGSSGLALYHFYYNAYNPNEASEDRGSEIIASIVESINQGYNFHTFCGGIAGAAWTIELLNELDFIELDTDALLGVLDEYLNHVAHLQEGGNFYDFLHGLIGIGYYFLKRYENTPSEELKGNYEKMILEIISKLESKATRSDNGIYWESNLVKEEGIIGCNLSLSHGLSSIINFLSRLSSHAAFSEHSLPLLNKAISHMMSYKRKETETSFFPDWITNKNEESQSNRLAWCYGDLGIAVSLWKASKVIEDEAVKQTAIQLLKHAATRRDIKETRIVDAGLCHGAFGVMHIFDFMYKETSDEIFKEAADYWIDYGLTMDHHEDGSAGYKKWRGGDTPTYEKENSLLEGIAGIGLAILSYLHPENTHWNQCLMIG
ncbi:lanthionine synthetase C family protein [Dokdonia pacifica]|uniref:Lanthionine synthetase C-like protein n=1 Tax=Dokdonia pacifica TaxID=1627892 RepID=A0A239A0W0_9FLAO|nr:lanthionine synthetase C family protein [Dokdonia pacifica]SNR89285.1 Lanthionine synthetase C-like protein [Dokdonia pacifica]